MGKFARTGTSRVGSPIVTTEERTTTYEGDQAWVREPKSELFLLAASNMVGEPTFYEAEKDRDRRYARLIHQVTASDPDWMRQFIPYLRDKMQMRSASIVAAAEYIHAGGPQGRALVRETLKRSDEPAEIIAYWHLTYGRHEPKPLKRGVADWLRDNLNEYGALKYDHPEHLWRLGDIVERVHPKAKAEWQDELFHYLLDVRHNRVDERTPMAHLPMVAGRKALYSIPLEQRRSVLDANPSALADSGITWENLSGWLQGPMDKDAWEAIIPSMGYMALLRNLRNFEEKGVGSGTLGAVNRILADPENVDKSRQFPMRFLSAWRATGSMTFASALEQALERSVSNVPSLPGRTLILIDCSGSMQPGYWLGSDGPGTVDRKSQAGVFGFSLAKRAESADVWLFGSACGQANFSKSGSVLRATEQLPDLGGTDTWGALRAAYAGHDRVVILTDEQSHSGARPELPVPVYIFNLAGYKRSNTPPDANYITFGGGLTDTGFRALDVLVRGRDSHWPWEEESTPGS